MHERLAWLIVLATIPAGITGLLLEHALRTLFAKPVAAALLTANGVILLIGERLRRDQARRCAVAPVADALDDMAPGRGISSRFRPGAVVMASASAPGRPAPSAVRLTQPAAGLDDPADSLDTAVATRLRAVDALIIGLFQVLALLARISRSGVPRLPASAAVWTVSRRSAMPSSSLPLSSWRPAY